MLVFEYNGFGVGSGLFHVISRSVVIDGIAALMVYIDDAFRLSDSRIVIYFGCATKKSDLLEDDIRLVLGFTCSSYVHICCRHR
jgi:hypothetical protein